VVTAERLHQPVQPLSRAQTNSVSIHTLESDLKMNSIKIDSTGTKLLWGFLYLPVMLGCQSFNHQAKLGSILQAPKPIAHQHSSGHEITSSEQADLLVESAIAAEERGDYQLAFSQYRQVIYDNPDHLQGNRRLAALHAKRGETTESVDLFSKLILNHPSDPELLCDYAYSLYLADQFPQADQELQKALAIKPELMRARGLRGMIFARNGDIDRAILEFTDAGIRKAEVHANIALAMLRNGDIEAASASLNSAENFHPKQETQNRIQRYRVAIKSASHESLNDRPSLSSTISSTKTL